MEESAHQPGRVDRDARDGARVTAILVTYNSEATILDALDALAQLHRHGLVEAVVVDNGSSDGTVQVVRDAHPWAEMIQSGENLGFGRGCNRGFRSVDTPYALLLNPDAALAQGALQCLTAFLEDRPEVGVVAPAISLDEGGHQCTRPIPTPWTLLRDAMPGRGGGEGIQEQRPGMPARQVEWASGAVLLFRTDLFRDMAGFDPRFFLYWEETDLLRRIGATARAEIWIVPDALALHVGGGSTAQEDGEQVGGDIADHFYRSRLYYLLKHHGPAAAFATEAGEVILLGAREAVRRVLGRGPGKLAERLRGPVFQLPDNRLPAWTQAQSAPSAQATPAESTREQVATALAVVVIGRNEEANLERSLRSALAATAKVLYVDSASEDGSVGIATSLGASVLELDPARPLSAARARNEGLARITEENPDVGFVQFVDGDCELTEGWCERALAFLTDQPGVGIVCGRLRERHPEASIYNRLCAIEWDAPAGDVAACGGIHQVRVADFRRVGGFDPSMLAGEEPELCLRLRRLGPRVERLDADMASHDAELASFGAWWERSVRGGFASAAGCARHGLAPERHKVRSIGSVLLWTVLIPLLALVVWPYVLLLYPIQIVRIQRARARRGLRGRDAWAYAGFLMLAKFAELQGFVRYLQRARRGTTSGTANP